MDHAPDGSAGQTSFAALLSEVGALLDIECASLGRARRLLATRDAELCQVIERRTAELGRLRALQEQVEQAIEELLEREAAELDRIPNTAPQPPLPTAQPAADPPPVSPPDSPLPEPESELEPEPVLETKPVLEPVLEPVPQAQPDVMAAVVEPAIVETPPQDPVVDGKLTELLTEGREDLAWLWAEATAQPVIRQRGLAFFAGAMMCDPASLEVSLSDVLPEATPEHPDDCAVLLAACLRFGLSSGYSPISMQPLVERADIRHPPLRQLVLSALDAVQHGGRRPAADGADYALLDEWHGMAEKARLLKSELASRRLIFHRATMVLHHLARDDQPLGRALLGLAELAAAGPESVADAPLPLSEPLRVLRDPKSVDAIIRAADAAVSSPNQLLNKIHSDARARLLKSVEEVAQLLLEGSTIASRLRHASMSVDLSDLYQLRRAGEAYEPAAAPGTPGGAALHRLAEWVRENPPRTSRFTLPELRDHALRLVFELPRDEAGRLIANLEPGHLDGVLAGRTAEEAVTGFLDAGNITLARLLIAELDQPTGERLADAALRAEHTHKQEHQRAVRSADAAIAKLRSVGLDEPARELEGQLGQLRLALVDRYDARRAPLAAIVDTARTELDGYRRTLEGRLGELAPAPEDLVRIQELLEKNDEVTANEFVTRLESDLELPPASQSQRDDFAEFFPAVVELAVAHDLAGKDPQTKVLTSVVGRSGASAPRSRVMHDGLRAWREMYNQYYQRTKSRGSEQEFRRQLGDVLRMLGLMPANSNSFVDVTETHRNRMAVYEVAAKPIDQSYVPQLGTQANGRYTVLLVFQRPTSPSRLLDMVPESRRNSANLILYFGTLNVEQRTRLRQLNVMVAGKGSPTMVVDEAVIGWLATQEEPGFRVTQRVTLPFTAINPYTPFAGGDVPSEVFVGREMERHDVESPTGSMFVYGGRQLGKSALLRRIEKLYNEQPATGRSGRRVALYLDLKSESIGERQTPDALWSALIRPLHELGVLAENRPNMGPDRVMQHIGDWLRADRAHQLLLLLDESDMFLTADSKPGPSGTGEFRTLQRLKSLMASSDRRFKVVFAGLHQVQRFHDMPNTPVAHGGSDILIGPLRPTEVRKLVVDPMRAIGYGFETEGLVWRIAALTNYQASLVQIFCDALVEHMHKRPPQHPGRMLITSDDVDGVYANRAVRELIAQRFRWTINLDSRYRVIALVVALLSVLDGAGKTYSVEDLHVWCAAAWPDGFAADVLRQKEFEGYLDEMVGLGVLHSHDDRYGIRSPNVVALLGTRADRSERSATRLSSPMCRTSTTPATTT